MSRRICVMTGTRADYGHLRWILDDLHHRPDVTLQLMASGAHLSPRHGMTISEIEADGLPIAARVDLALGTDTPLGVAASLGLGVARFAEALSDLKPDLLVVLGDRYEALAVAQAAMVLGIPIAHLHGGEATEGVMDEAIRHAITKMSHLHMVAAEPYRRRVIQLGEAPERVFNTGAPGLDVLTRIALPDLDQLSRDLGMAFPARPLLVTYHPVIRGADPALMAEELTAALDLFPERPVVVTGVNADPGASAVDAVLHRWAAARPGRAKVFASLGYRRYLGLMAHAALVVGNSSSGIIEAPALKVPTVNIGSRQRGRLRAPSVFDCAEDRQSIVAAMRHALSNDVQTAVTTVASPYGSGGASARIVEILATYPLDGILSKSFHEVGP